MTAIETICSLKRLQDEDQSRVTEFLRQVEHDLRTETFQESRFSETACFHTITRHTSLLARLAH